MWQAIITRKLSYIYWKRKKPENYVLHTQHGEVDSDLNSKKNTRN